MENIHIEKNKPDGTKTDRLKNRTGLLRYEQVQICYNGKQAVKDVTLTVTEGEILALVGESGSGKSTLLRAANGLLGNGGMVTRGDIFYRTINIPDADPETLRGLRGPEIGMVFQDAAAYFHPLRKIKVQFYESVLAHEKKPKEQIYKEAAELLTFMEIHDVERILNSYPSELSGGLNQRVGIAMAMLLHPSLLLADEPTSALDIRVQAKVIEELLRLREKYGTTILMVTHNIGMAQRVADRIAVMYRGDLLECGKTEQIMQNPESSYTRELLQAVPRPAARLREK